jgi:hypothetical protein
MSYDDSLLLSAGADGAVALLDVRDKELAKSSTRRDMVRGTGGSGPGQGRGRSAVRLAARLRQGQP